MDHLLSKEELGVGVKNGGLLLGEELEEEDQPEGRLREGLVDRVEFLEFDALDADFGNQRGEDARVGFDCAPLGHFCY